MGLMSHAAGQETWAQDREISPIRSLHLLVVQIPAYSSRVTGPWLYTLTTTVQYCTGQYWLLSYRTMALYFSLYQKPGSLDEGKCWIQRIKTSNFPSTCRETVIYLHTSTAIYSFRHSVDLGAVWRNERRISAREWAVFELLNYRPDVIS